MKTENRISRSCTSEGTNAQKKNPSSHLHFLLTSHSIFRLKYSQIIPFQFRTFNPSRTKPSKQKPLVSVSTKSIKRYYSSHPSLCPSFESIYKQKQTTNTPKPPLPKEKWKLQPPPPPTPPHNQPPPTTQNPAATATVNSPTNVTLVNTTSAANSRPPVFRRPRRRRFMFRYTLRRPISRLRGRL